MIYVCSPYSAYKGHTVEQNVAEAKEFCRQIIAQGQVPICPQIWLPEFLDDRNPLERAMAIKFCKIMLEQCDRVYAFLGEDDYVSNGMRLELDHAESIGLAEKIDFVTLSSPLRGKYRKTKYQEEINTLVSMYKEIPTSLHNSIFAKTLDTAIKVLKEAK